MSKSLKDAEEIARALQLELQAVAPNQALSHFQARISEMPQEVRGLVDAMIGVTLVYGNRTDQQDRENPNTETNDGTFLDNGRWTTIFVKKKGWGLFVLAVVIVIAAIALSPSRSTESGTGRDELRELRSADRENLIIFVHGIRDDGELTWTNEDTNSNWTEMISDDSRFSSFDLASYHYSARLFQSGSLSISNVSDQLAFRMDQQLVGSYDNIVFVAHSMGGVVVRNLLLKNAEISKKVPLIYFLATPTSGSDIASLASIIDVGNRQLDGLTSLERSNFLQDQSSAWRSSRLFLDIYSLCAFETQPTLEVLVVNQASAQSLCTGPTIPSGETHSGIAKPYSDESLIYKVFADRISDIFGVE